jgi:NADP-dependent 3-hydroxy acid dehydrogenase YdfG
MRRCRSAGSGCSTLEPTPRRLSDRTRESVLSDARAQLGQPTRISARRTGYLRHMADGHRAAETSGRRPRVAVITGASAGVGRATARALARRGWSLGLLARGQRGLDGACEEARRAGVRAVAVPTDVADAKAVISAADQVEDELGPIDAWINNAMASVFGPFLEVSLDDVRRVTEVTYLGYVHGTRAALEHMRPRGRGVIVQVGSALAFRGIPLQAAYCGAKHAVRGFSGSIRSELLHDRSRIRICEVHLPALDTPQFRWVRSVLRREARPVPPIYEPEVAADAIAWILTHPRRSIWVGPSTVGTIVANAIAPGLLDRYLARTGYRSQQTREPRDPDRPDNLYAPVDRDVGAHGPFAGAAHAGTTQLRVSKRVHELVESAAARAIDLLGVDGARSGRD